MKFKEERKEKKRKKKKEKRKSKKIDLNDGCGVSGVRHMYLHLIA